RQSYRWRAPGILRVSVRCTSGQTWLPSGAHLVPEGPFVPVRAVSCPRAMPSDARGRMGRRIEMAEFDPKKVSTLDWVVIGAGGLAFIDSFLPWYTASVSFSGISRSDSAGAWSAGFAAWFSVLLLIAAGGLVLANAMGAQINL